MNEYGDGLKCNHAHTAWRELSKVKVVNRYPWAFHSKGAQVILPRDWLLPNLPPRAFHDS